MAGYTFSEGKVIVELAAADLIASATAPFPIIPAPPSGSVIVVRSAFLSYRVGSTAFQQVGSYVSLYYGSAFPWVLIMPGPSGGYAFFGATDLVGIFDIQGFGTASTNVAGQPLNLIAPVNVGPVATFSIGASSGTGYSIGDTGLISGGDGTAEYVVDTVDGSGAVLTFHLDNNGNSYANTVNSVTSIETGSGDGTLTINIDSVTLGNGTATLHIDYAVVSLS